ncbi:putative bifunctional diguanylate cyclase/phosphodiesterase [Streptomyces sp. Da 82-17]|uniref:putative bifunctional diguanylate cyclase/phosphodiesterase n=1 Tax=Streptomyces sp. Da 82-17 TaxID=3377116 RepID=UPI0038D4DA28
MLRAHRPMAAFAGLVAAATAAFLIDPALRTPLSALTGIAGVAAILYGVHRNRPARRWPWWLLAAGLTSFAAGDAFYNLLALDTDSAEAFPTAADACYLAAYPLFAAAFLGLVRYRRADRDLPSLLDALIVTAGLALPLWVHLVQPVARDDRLMGLGHAVSVAYPLADVLVLALLAQLLTPGTEHGARNRSVQLLVLGTVVLLGTDIAYGILQINGVWQAGTAFDTGWVVVHLAWGLAALHPAMAALTSYDHGRQTLLPPPHRLVILGAATLVPPGMLLAEGLSGGARDALVIAAFSAIVFVLVVLRLAGIVVAHRKAVAREQALRSAGASLVAATNEEQIAVSCDATVGRLLGAVSPPLTGPPRGSRRPYGTLFLVDDAESPAGHLVAAAREPRIVPAAELPPDVEDAFYGLPAVVVCPLTPPDRPVGDDPPGVLLAAGHERQLAEIRGSLEILAAHAGLALERVQLRRQVTRRESEAYFQALVRNASDVILIVDDDDTVRYASPAADTVFGEDRLTGRRLPDLVDPRDRDRAAHVLAGLRDGTRPEPHDHWWMPCADGRIEAAVQGSDLRADPTVAGLVVTLRDVTEQRQLEQELTQRAFHDGLTGLPNRTLLLERVERALLRGDRESTLTCVLYIDLDDFKLVNDTMGHAAGDQLLTAVGHRLSRTLRRTDTAARLGGDEFAVLMEGVAEAGDAELLAAEVVRELGRPFRLGDDSVSVSASVGVATALDSSDAEELLGHADLALYAAKSAGKRQWRRFQPWLDIRVRKRHELQAALEQAVADEEFAVRYQPVVDLEIGRVVGFEALLRWHLPGRDPVPPREFIPLAEETGQIMALGAWTLARASADMAELQESTDTAHPPFVSVNVSARQFHESGFLHEVGRVLDTVALAPGTLQLELTESVLMRRDERTQGVMRALREYGVRIALDGFGTGFSSFGYLREFPVDVVKIDRTFIADVPHDARQSALVAGIVRIADTLGLQVIAEGVEEPEQCDALAGMGCGFGQGFLFAGPLTARQGAFLLRRPPPHLPLSAAVRTPSPPGRHG